MPIQRSIAVPLLAGLLLAAPAGAPGQAAPIPAAVAPDDASSGEAKPLSDCEVIARVNSEVILACELEWQVRLMIEQRLGPSAKALVDSPMFSGMRDEAMKNLVISQIEVALLYSDFRSNAPMADLAGIQESLQPMFQETEVPRLMKVVGVEDRAALEAKLLELGTSLGERRAEFFRTMIARSWLTQSIKYDKEITHEQMLKHYRERLDDYAQPDRARWEELMVKFDRFGSKREAYAELARLGNRAHAAASRAGAAAPAFAELAAESDGFTADEGGAYDWTDRGTLAAEAVDNALFTLPPGQMSGILEGPLGFHIVRVLERRDAGPTAFRDVQADIRKALNDERFGDAVNAKLTKLKRSARL
ncbi:MAG: peptidylprolyl isomerase, partial [Planctomycetota bacterium]